jgi:hypothetical protein
MQQRGHRRDEREAQRLELVGLACEIAVVAGHIDEDLAPVQGDAAAQDLRASCSEHRRVAQELLAPETLFEALSPESLLQALDAFRARQREIVRLRSQVDRLLQAGGDDDFCSAFL